MNNEKNNENDPNTGQADPVSVLEWIAEMDDEEVSQLLQTIVENKLILNDTEENQGIAKMILKHMGLGEDEVEDGAYVQDLNTNLRRGHYGPSLEADQREDEKIVFHPTAQCFVTVISKDGYFDDPRGVLQVNNKILIVDSNRRELVLLNADSTTEALITSETNTFQWPIGICAGLNENEILVSDVSLNRMVSYNMSTREIKTIADRPAGLEKKPDNTILPECSLMGPRGLCNDGNRIIVCDSNNNAIQVMENGTMGPLKATNPAFCLPTGAVVDRQGDLIICDCENNCLQKITKTGEVIVIAGTPGKSGYVDGPAADALLSWPYSAVIYQDNIIFCEAGNDSLRVLKPNGMVSTLVYKSTRASKAISAEELRCACFRGNNFKLQAPRGLCLCDNGELILTESVASRVSRVIPMDWTTTRWVLMIGMNENELSYYLLPELIRSIAIIAFRSWKF